MPLNPVLFFSIKPLISNLQISLILKCKNDIKISNNQILSGSKSAHSTSNVSTECYSRIEPAAHCSENVITAKFS
jgi:hypothetical protein